jgi:transposase
MSDNRFAEKIVGLPEFTITDVKRSETTMHYYVEKTDKPRVCPHCGVIDPTVRVHGSRIQDVRDIGYSKTHVGLIFKRKRYLCMECGQTFLELCDSIAPKARMTNRLRDYIAKEARGRAFIDLERELDISNVTIREIFLEEMQKLKSGQQVETPEFIGIDEIHITRKDSHRKVAWAVLCNGNDHTVLDILDNRNKSTIIEYLKGLQSPYNVRLVTMDMWKNYKDAVYATLPNASIVIDKFHVVKMANEALDDYRLAMKATLGKERNLKLKQERYLVLSRNKSLNMTSQIFRDAWFCEFPEFRTVYELKEAFFTIFDTDYSRLKAIKAYNDWKASIPEGLTVFDELIDTVDNWSKEIFNYFDLRYNEKRITNSFVEGANSAIRKIEAYGSGYDFDVLRAKVMMCVGHKIETPDYGSGTFSYMFYRPSPKDYGVPFKNIIRAINDGLL